MFPGEAGVSPAKKLRIENCQSELLVIIQRFLRERLNNYRIQFNIPQVSHLNYLYIKPYSPTRRAVKGVVRHP